MAKIGPTLYTTIRSHTPCKHLLNPPTDDHDAPAYHYCMLKNGVFGIYKVHGCYTGMNACYTNPLSEVTR